MEISAVSKKMKELGDDYAGLKPFMEFNTDEIIERVAKLIRQNKKMSVASKVDIPVAVAISKLDTIASMIPVDYTVMKPSLHCTNRYFDIEDEKRINNEIQTMLQEWSADGLISQLEFNYSNYSCFAISSFGLDNCINQYDNVGILRPHRIEDPILWIFKENAVIKGK